MMGLDTNQSPAFAGAGVFILARAGGVKGLEVVGKPKAAYRTRKGLTFQQDAIQLPQRQYPRTRRMGKAINTCRVALIKEFEGVGIAKPLHVCKGPCIPYSRLDRSCWQ
jgi:hypothetical protein